MNDWIFTLRKAICVYIHDKFKLELFDVNHGCNSLVFSFPLFCFFSSTFLHKQLLVILFSSFSLAKTIYLRVNYIKYVSDMKEKWVDTNIRHCEIFKRNDFILISAHTWEFCNFHLVDNIVSSLRPFNLFRGNRLTKLLRLFESILWEIGRWNGDFQLVQCP